MSIVPEEQAEMLPHGGASPEEEGDNGVQTSSQPVAAVAAVQQDEQPGRRALQKLPSRSYDCLVSEQGVIVTGVGAASGFVEDQLARRLTRVKSELALSSFQSARYGTMGRAGAPAAAAGESCQSSTGSAALAAIVPAPGGSNISTVSGEQEETRCGICLDAGDFISTAPCNHAICGGWGHTRGMTHLRLRDHHDGA